MSRSEWLRGRGPRFVWLIVTAVLFAAWIGWLAFLSVQRHSTVVLPHAPFLVSDLNVVATVPKPDDRVTVEEVPWARDEKDAKGLVGQEVRVTNLKECGGWAGPGRYLLPLLKTGPDTYEVSDATGISAAQRRQAIEEGRLPASRSPGSGEVPPLMYPANPGTLAQLRQIHGQP
jgi:hypothetical protein